MVNDRSSVRPPAVVMRLVTVYDWPAVPPESQTVAEDAVFESAIFVSPVGTSHALIAIC